NGEFSLVDSTVTETLDSLSSTVSPYGRVVLRSVDSKISAALSTDEVRIAVDRLTLKAPTFSTQLEQFSTNLQYSKEKFVLKNLTLRTLGSALTMNAEAESLNVSEELGSKVMQKHRVHLDMDAPRISFDELRKFLPACPLRNGTVRLNLVFNGSLGNLLLEKLDLRTEHSGLKVAGRIQDLLHPKDCTLDLTLSASTLDLPEVSKYLPSVHLPDVSHLEKANLSGHFKGKLENFEAKVVADLRAIGRVELEGQLDLRGPIPQYQGKFLTKELDIRGLLHDERFESRLNISGEISGRGTKLEDADLTANVTVDSSEIFNVPLENSALSITAKNKLLRSDASLRSNRSTLRIQSSIDLHDETAPAYDLQGEFLSLNLAKLFQDDDYMSELNGSVTLRGSGRDLDHATGNLDLNFQESRFRNHAFQGPGIKLTLDQRQHTKKTVHLASPIFDANIEGDFHLTPFLSLVKYQVRNILRSLKEKLPFVDSTRMLLQAGRAVGRPIAPQIPKALAGEYLNFNYAVEVKNLTPLAIFLGEEDFKAKASISGSVVGNADDLLLSVAASADNFVYRGKEARILITKGKAYVQVDHLKQENILDVMENKIDVTASTFILNGLRMNNLTASVDYLHGQGSFDVSALIDSTLTVETNGAVTVAPEGYLGNLNNLTVDYKGYVWSNTTPIVAVIDSTGLTLKNVEMAHRTARFFLSGGIRPSHELALEMKIKNYELSDLRYFLPLEGGTGGQKTLQGIVSGEARLTGRLADPTFTINVASSDLKYGNVAFGIFEGEARYRQRMVAVNLELRSSSPTQMKKPDLLVAGALPIDLALTHVDDRVPDEPLDLRVEASGFRLDLLDPFIPVFDNIEGRFFADLRVGGTMKNLSASGSMRLEDGKFVFTPNGITYYVSGAFEPKDDKILISKLNIRNDARDEEAKGLTVNGEITMQELFIGA
ncbi:MAG: hypothetical protein AABZ61_05350, partial [Bacteroidota bacterium]